MNREEMLRLGDAELQRAQEILEARYACEMEILQAIRQIFKPKGAPEQEEEWVMLKDLRPGTVFVTRDGTYAVKSEYFYTGDSESQCECVLLASGEYAHFRDGNQTLVREASVAGLAESVTGPSTELLGERDHFAGFAKLETEEICSYLYFSSVDKETIAIVRPYINTFLAQCAYNLVQHALTILDLPECINSIPDLTE